MLIGKKIIIMGWILLTALVLVILSLNVQAKDLSAEKMSSTSKEITKRDYIVDIAYNGSIYVAVGYYSRILLSNDAITWRGIKLNVQECITGIASNGKDFVLVGTGGLIMVSEDGVKWSRKSYIEDKKVGHYIGRIFEGQYYNSKEPLKNKYFDYTDITWNGKQFLIVGRMNETMEEEKGLLKLPLNIFLTSVDGVKWNKNFLRINVYNDSDGIIRCVWDGDKYVTISTDFNENGDKNPFFEYETVLFSKNGLNWSSHKITFPRNLTLTSIAYNGKIYIAVGHTPVEGYWNIRGYILRSQDGVHWNEVKKIEPFYTNWEDTREMIDKFPLFSVMPRNVIWTGKNFAMSVQDGIYYSSNDGSVWNKTTIEVAPGVANYILSEDRDPLRFHYSPALIWDGQKYIAGGEDETIITSPDLCNWEYRSGTIEEFN
ncbi:MAG: hypothetical protein K0S71_1871 [Clostridia bacterium]|jgi:hypothetical protein|nr:hypothetical protein [Clostridia bacterium]